MTTIIDDKNYMLTRLPAALRSLKNERDILPFIVHSRSNCRKGKQQDDILNYELMRMPAAARSLKNARNLPFIVHST